MLVYGVQDLRNIRLGVLLEGALEGLLTARYRCGATDLELDEAGPGADGEKKAEGQRVPGSAQLVHLDIYVEGDCASVLPRLEPDSL